jgi:3-hydroxyisobutyrate dehydrogenase
MANQIAIAGSLLGAVEAISYAKNAGLDPQRILRSIANGSAQSWQLSNNVPRMLEGDFGPGFYVKHFLKDLRIALDSARAMKIELPMLALAEQLFARMTAEGMGDLGTQAVYLMYERGLV